MGGFAPKPAIFEGKSVAMNVFGEGAHLIGVPSPRSPIPLTLEDADSLDWFTSFYVNKYIDHHAFETLHQ